jgi:hypothetical protein
MTQDKSITSSLNTFGHEDLKGFASYLGMEYEDLLKVQRKNNEIIQKYLESHEN